jgi:peptide/nickel transport system substrate-binding protein
VVRFEIESNPANLDPRYATDGQSQRIVGLIFSGLVERDAEMNLRGDLAESWETPDALTYVFHLRRGVKFHDGKEVTSKDVKATFEWMMNPANRSPKRGAFRLVTAVEAPEAYAVVFRLKEPYASFLWNLARPAIGIVPADSGADFARRPIGTGPFRFVSQTQDDEVVVERNENYFREEEEKKDQGQRRDAENTEVTRRKEDPSPANDTKGGASSIPIQRVTFRVVPDTVVRALELRKGGADIEVSSLSPDMIPVMEKQADLLVTERPGTNLAYLGINFEDPVLAKREVRRALAYATDREALIKYLLRGEAQLATGVLPPNHWAYDGNVKKYAYDPAEAEKLLDAAGFPRKADGVRIRVALKVSTEEQARLIGAALQEQWRRAGIALEVRPLEIATLFSDLAKGNFQLSYSVWIGANNDPDFFEYAFSSKRFPPDGANRGHYRNARMDLLTDKIRGEMNREKRKELCGEAQRIFAEDLPYVPLWFRDVVSVHRKWMGKIALTPTGDYEFLAR